MRTATWTAAVVSLAVLALPALAHADLTVGVSAGSGWQVSPRSERIATNIMVAPGIELLASILRAEVGLVTDMGDIDGEDVDLEVRPMVIFDPPLIPLYGRLTVGMTRLLDGPVAVAFGGSLGAEVTFSAVSLFGEVGYIPRASGAGFDSVFEGRAGVWVTF